MNPRSFDHLFAGAVFALAPQFDHLLLEALADQLLDVDSSHVFF